MSLIQDKTQCPNTKVANTSNSDHSLARHGMNPYYWYSVEDGVNLLRSIRQHHLDYTNMPAVSNPGEECSYFRENVNRILLTDPYHSRASLKTLTNWISHIISVPL